MSIGLSLDEVIAEFRAEFRALHEKIDALSALNGHVEIEWFDAEAAATYLSRSKRAVESAWSRGTIPSVVSPDGRRRSSKRMLDAYMLGNGTKP
jgi:hypothetical protein